MIATADKSGGGRTVLAMFVAGFGFIAAVNGIFIYLALKTNTGLVTENPYEKGLAYNDLLAAEEKQEKSGFQTAVDFRARTLTFQLKDRDGQTVKGARVQAAFIRPVQDGYDFTVDLAEKSPGVYVAAVDPPLVGAWTTKLEATWNGHSYRTTYRLIAP